MPALDVQIEQCQSFIARSQRRLAELDKQRAAEEELLTEARTWLERLRLEAEQCRATPAKPKTGSAPIQIDGSAEVQRLQQMVVELQSKLSSVGIQRDIAMQDVEHSKKRFREDYVPACVEDLVQWMSDRQKDLQEAMVSGRIQDVPRLAKLVADGGRPVEGMDRKISPSRHDTGFFVRKVSTWGLRGVRVGEASHPAPSTGQRKQTTPVQEPEWGQHEIR